MDGRLASLRRNPFLWLLVLAAAVRLALIFLVSPITDGFYFTTESVSCILSLNNPYNHTFNSVPYNLLTRGSESIFAYLPFVTVYSTPFYLLGDIRYGFVLGDLLIGYVIYRTNLRNGGRKPIVLSAVYLLSPFTIGWAVWAGVNTNVGVAFLMLSIMFLQENKELEASACFGLSLAALQLSWIPLPFLFHYSLKKGMRRFGAYSLAACGIFLIPFLAFSLRETVNDVLLFHLTRQTTPVFAMATFPHAEVNISINGFLNALFEFTLPMYVKILILLPALFLFVKSSTGLRETIYFALVYSLVFLFVLPNNLLINYLVLPFSLLLIPFSPRSIVLAWPRNRRL